MRWSSITIGEIAQVKGGKRLPKGAAFATQVTDFPYIRVTDFHNNSVRTAELKYLTPSIQSKLRNYTISKSDVYISIAGTIGLVGVVPDELDGANLTENAAKLVITSRFFDNGFLAYYLASEVGQSQIESLTAKTTQPKLALARIGQIVISHPPLAEQRAIAHFLQTTQAAMEIRQRELVLERERKDALMHNLFTHGTRGEATAQTEIGEAPETWKIAALADLGEVVTGTTPRTEVPEYYDGTFPFIAPGDISDSPYVESTSKHLSEKGLAVSRVLPKDSVLVVCIGATIGKVAMTSTDRSTTNQQINSIIPNGRIFAEFLYYSLCFRARELPDLASRTAVPIINKSVFSQFRIPVPDQEEQSRIAAVLGACDRKITALKEELKVLRELFRASLDELMSGLLEIDALPDRGSKNE